jgi:hypothetical protein
MTVVEVHGPPLLIGFSLGALLLWRKQRGTVRSEDLPMASRGIE